MRLACSSSIVTRFLAVFSLACLSFASHADGFIYLGAAYGVTTLDDDLGDISGLEYEDGGTIVGAQIVALLPGKKTQKNPGFGLSISYVKMDGGSVDVGDDTSVSTEFDYFALGALIGAMWEFQTGSGSAYIGPELIFLEGSLSCSGAGDSRRICEDVISIADMDRGSGFGATAGYLYSSYDSQLGIGVGARRIFADNMGGASGYDGTTDLFITAGWVF